MIRRAAAALAVCVLVVLLTAAARAPTELALAPVTDATGFTAMDVAVTFNGEMDGETVLDLPDEWGGETELWRALRDVRADGAQMLPGADAAHRVLRHAPGARITVRYRVTGNGGARDNGGNDYRPLIKPTYFHLIGNAIVALPEHARMKDPATFRIEGMPAGASFASDLEHTHKRGGLTVLDLQASVAVGGDFRLLDAGGGVRVAIRGTWPRDDATWRTQVQRIGAGQRAYWGTRDEPYLVTIMPLDLPPGSKSIGGTGLDDAFAFFATTNSSADKIDTILSHEMMHTWISNRIGGLPEKDEAASYWLSEGFTDWASFRTNVRSGLWSPEDFAREFNEALEAYELSPARTASNAQILAAFWNNEELQKLPYRRGMLLATRWDARLRAQTGGRKDFDDVLLSMQRVAARRGDVTATQIFPVVMKRLGADVGPDLLAVVEQGALVDLPVDVFAPCGTIVTRQQAPWERGFDFDATRRADWVIAGVAEDSNAYAAGLRNGMQLRSWSESASERFTDRPVTAGVSDAGVRRDITWLPVARETRPLRRFELSPTMDRAACVKRLGGE